MTTDDTENKSEFFHCIRIIDQILLTLKHILFHFILFNLMHLDDML